MATSTARIDTVDLDRFRRLLLQERATLAGHVVPATEGWADEAPPAAGELDGLRYEQGMTAAVASINRSALADVDTALGRIDDGSYGRCLGCDGTIPVERLEVMPAAGFCVSCQQSRE